MSSTFPLRFSILIAAASFTTALALGSGAEQAPPTRDSPVDDAADLKLVETVCGSCHTLDSILHTRHTRPGWEKIIDWMIDEGAAVTDEEYETVAAYLTRRHGKVDVNEAPLGELRAVLDLTDKDAARLIAARAAGRTFKTLTDLEAVLDVDLAFLEARKARIVFSSR
jgi:DNA uptake protein ComE-like DNA-binding protein